jgi:hypothetical protein
MITKAVRNKNVTSQLLLATNVTQRNAGVVFAGDITRAGDMTQSRVHTRTTIIPLPDRRRTVDDQLFSKHARLLFSTRFGSGSTTPKR